MSIVHIVLALLLVGFLVWAITTAPIPIHPWIKNILVGVIFFALLIWLLNQFGVHTGINLRI